MLPQSPGVAPETCIPELVKCVEQYGNVAINLNPDPSGGHWTSPPLSDRHWYPIYEKMVEYDIPAMVHVSTSCNACFHTTGAHYINADTTAFMQCLTSGPVHRLPDAEVHHPARRRRRALPLGPLPRPGTGAEEAAAEGPPAEEHLLRHLRLPPARHRPADQGDSHRERALRQRDDRRRARHRPRDRALLRRHQALHRSRCAHAEQTAHAIYEGNARRVYPRLDAALKKKGL
jgi:4-oxalmesaconate hydratase